MKRHVKGPGRKVTDSVVLCIPNHVIRSVSIWAVLLENQG
jgi:hypothetical protein